MTERLRVYSEEWRPGIVRMDLRGELTCESYERLEEEFQHWFDDGVSRFVIRMHELTVLSNVGAGVLIGLIRSSQDRGGRAALVQPRPAALETLERFHVLSLTCIAASQEEGLRECALGFRPTRRRRRLQRS